MEYPLDTLLFDLIPSHTYKLISNKVVNSQNLLGCFMLTMEKSSSRTQRALDILTEAKVSYILPRFYTATHKAPCSHSLIPPPVGSGRELEV